jgi:hypothetical protein
MTIIDGINVVPTPGSLIPASVYALVATGGFDMEAGFKTVTTLDQSPILTYDVTNALQIELPANFFNSRLGTYDADTQSFKLNDVANDSITFTADEFKAALLVKTQIVHVGAYANMYANFQTYVTTYFGLPNGFASLFSKASATLIQSGADDTEHLFNLFTASFANDLTGAAMTGGEPTDISEINDEISGNYIKDLSGTILISNVVQLLRYAVDYNAFGNRIPIGEDDANGATNYGVNDRFIAGDLFYVPTGTRITLDLDISPELQQVPLNNPNSSNSSEFGPLSGSNISGLTGDAITMGATFNSSSATGDYSIASTVTRTNIHRVLKVPLLLRVTVDPV